MTDPRKLPRRRTEYIWPPLPDGGAIPIGMYRNGQSYAIHTDHLGTPRQMTDGSGTPVWQWPYSAFGQNRPIGVLVPTTDPLQATTIEPTMLRATTPTVTLDLRFPGQMADVETATFFNYYRNYVASQGRYSQFDPIGLHGGLRSQKWLRCFGQLSRFFKVIPKKTAPQTRRPALPIPRAILPE